MSLQRQAANTWPCNKVCEPRAVSEVRYLYEQHKIDVVV